MHFNRGGDILGRSADLADSGCVIRILGQKSGMRPLRDHVGKTHRFAADAETRFRGRPISHTSNGLDFCESLLISAKL